MPKNRVQFQKAMSLSQFMSSTVAKRSVSRRCLAGAGRKALCARLAQSRAGMCSSRGD